MSFFFFSCEKYLSQRASTTAAEFVAKALQPVAAEANTEAPIAKSDSRAGKADKRRRADTVVESSSKKRKNNAEQAVPVESQSDAQQAPEQQGAVDTNDVKVAAEPVAPISTEEVGSLLRDGMPFFSVGFLQCRITRIFMEFRRTHCFRVESSVQCH
jgi:hypothetical protein